MASSVVFCEGQRVYAPAEPYLGLGVVLKAEARRFTVRFAKAGEARTYSQETEALARFRAQVGDRIRTSDTKTHEVTEVVERSGLLSYVVREGGTFQEAELDSHYAALNPFAELALGRPGSAVDFDRRKRAYDLKALGRAHSLRGLGSARVQLLPHQLFVAERVSRMWRPRALLADEVGLGKTIEAGLIAVRMAALGRITTLAVVAPRALVGQWLAEFYRRFARPLVLFDLEETDLARDLLIAAEDLEGLPKTFRRDLIIVDEAHHYAEDPVLERLTEGSEAVLLLSATPSLGGEERLFRLLHLLDPLRYRNPSALSERGHRWFKVADLARSIEAGGEPSKVVAELKKLYPTEPDLQRLARAKDTQELLDRLVDRHGLGRSLLRNRRVRLGHLFPGRCLKPHHLKAGVKLEDYVVSFLQERSHQNEKVFIMVATPRSVAHWAAILRQFSRLRVARFDETMSLLERDRQAAWFHRPSDDRREGPGADVMICSEIGGEGRNFQVAHHLLLLDLPAHPDRLEQRIGRLDRIGQTHEVEVHVVLPDEDRRLAVRFAWLHRGLQAFKRSLTEGQRVFDRFSRELAAWEKAGPTSGFKAWLDEVRHAVEALQIEAEQAVDPLVDRASYREDQAEEITKEVEEGQKAMALALSSELPDLLDALGIQMESQGEERVFLVKPGDMMFVDALPGMPPEGCLVTLDRALANVREDLDFLHFEHRLVQGSLDLVIDEGVGRACAARWHGAPKTAVLFQFLLVWEADAPPGLGLDRFLPCHAQVVTVDLQGGVALGSCFPGGSELLEGGWERLGPDIVALLLERTEGVRKELLSRAKASLGDVTAKLKEKAKTLAEKSFEAETGRLSHLHHTDEESVADEELYQRAHIRLNGAREECFEVIERTDWRFDAVRLILCQAVSS